MKTATTATTIDLVKGLITAFRLDDCIEIREEKTDEHHFITLLLHDDYKGFSTFKNDRYKRVDNLLEALYESTLFESSYENQSYTLHELITDCKQYACYGEGIEVFSEYDFTDYEQFDFSSNEENQDEYELVEFVSEKALSRFERELTSAFKDMTDIAEGDAEMARTFHRW